jgi:FKBP-type peptidyl-prolyl cis-trans isomerase FkpA
MKLKSVIVLLISICFILCNACKQNAIEPNKQVKNKQKEELIQANRNIIKQEALLIRTFAKRQNWNVKETGSGLWIEVYRQGKGKKASTGRFVTIKYSLSLLDGTICYSSDSTGLKQFEIGSGKAESGLEEGLQAMQIGSAAHIIIPPHLGYGLIGDGNCIPPRAILVYKVELTDMK